MVGRIGPRLSTPLLTTLVDFQSSCSTILNERQVIQHLHTGLLLTHEGDDDSKGVNVGCISFVGKTALQP